MEIQLLFFIQSLFNSLGEAAVMFILLKNRTTSYYYLLLTWIIFLVSDHIPNFNIFFLPIIYTIIACLLANHFFFKKTIIEAFKVFVIDITIQILLELLLVIFASTVLHITINEMILDIKLLSEGFMFSNILWIVALALLKIMNSKRKDLVPIEISYITLMTGFSIMTGYCLFNIIETGEYHIINCIFILIAIITTSASFINLFKKYKDYCLIEAELERTQTILSSDDDMRKIKHDIANHLQTIQGLANANDEVYAYTSSLLDAYDSIPKRYCENHLVDTILCQKLHSTQDIKIDTDILIPITLSINSIDLASILFNALDNAIEACQRNTSTSSKISIMMKIDMGHLYIVIKNTKDPKEKTNNHTLKKGLHGYGLKNMNYVVQKYHGQIETVDHGEFYELKILMEL